MKMISRQRSSSKRKLVAIVVFAVVAVALLLSPFTRIGSVGAYLSRPLNSAFVFIPNTISHIKDRWQGIETLRIERDRLQNERDSYASRLTTLEASTEDFSMLQSIRNGNKDELIIAGILVLPNISPYDSLVIDKGERDGIKHGALVYEGENVPLGVIVRVERTTAVVLLFSSPGMNSHVYVLGPNIHAKAVGVGGGTINVFLPHGISVAEGDEIIMPTVSGEHIGTVGHVTSDPAEPGTIASVPHRISLSSLRFVTVEKEVYTLPTRETIEENMRLSTSTLSDIFTVPSDLFTATTSTSTSSTTP